MRLYLLLLILSAPCHAMDCTPTPYRTTGTHYEPVTEYKINISNGLIVRGQVLAAPNCTPVAQARVAHWQAGENGRYSDQLRAFLFTDAQGRFQFETEWPNLGQPHIHFIITASGFKKLETQWIGDNRQKEIVFDLVLEKEEE